MRGTSFWTLLLSLTIAFAFPAWSAESTSPIFDSAAKRTLIERAAKFLTENYVFPDLGERAARKISDALAAGEYSTITDPASFAAQLTVGLQSVTHDKHMVVYFHSENGSSGLEPPLPTNGGFLAVDRLKGNIGYINLEAFPRPGMFSVVANEAMRELAGTSALIIDLRNNGGGTPDAVTYLCSFFFHSTKPVHLNDLIFRNPSTVNFTTHSFWTKPVPTSYLNKPVYLLTSRKTFSGGEEFANDLKVQGRATLVGETTGGGANPGGDIPLIARFSIFIPRGRAENPVTKSNWEGMGVAPDISVDASQAFKVAASRIIAQLSAKSASRAHQLVNIRAKLNTDSDVDQFIERSFLTVRKEAQPASESALRRVIDEYRRGEPDYDLMSEYQATEVRENLGDIRSDLDKLGAVQTITFVRVGPMGADVYDVKCANGSVEWNIFLSPDGKIASAAFRRIL